MQCEMCGNEATRTRRFTIEGSVLNVCPDCERFGKSVERPAAKTPAVAANVGLAMERRRQQQSTRDVYASSDMQVELVADFALRIRTAREQKKWTRQDLGGRVGEREPTIARIEAGGLHPTDVVARKMERELGIKLFEPFSRVATRSQPTRALTLGDLLRDAQRKKKP